MTALPVQNLLTLFFRSIWAKFVQSIADKSLEAKRSSDTLRYEPGDVVTVTHKIGRVADGYGWVSLGLDGVFRSYAGNGTVIDWRQLDPDQIAADIVTHRRGASTVPAEAYGDGRLVIYINQLRQPWPFNAKEATTSGHVNVPRDCALADAPDAPDAILARIPDDVPCHCIACTYDRACYHSKLIDDCKRARLCSAYT
jgi:hypothetical protein